MKIYNYLYAKQGRQKASEYLCYLRPDLLSRRRGQAEEQIKQDAQQSPVAASVVSALMAPATGLSFVGQTAQMLAQGKVNEDEIYNAPSYLNSAMRGAVSQKVQEKWGPVGSFLYDTGMSMADFLMTGAASGGSAALSLALMGSSAAASTTIEAKDRGLRDDQAYTLGAVAGIAEILTEKVSIETLLDKTSLGKSARGYILKNILAEGSEEVASDLINLTADILVSRDKSQWQESVDGYMVQGMSRKEAFIQAVKDQALNTGLSFAGGALSGGVMAGAGVLLNRGRSPDGTDRIQPQEQQEAPEETYVTREELVEQAKRYPQTPENQTMVEQLENAPSDDAAWRIHEQAYPQEQVQETTEEAAYESSGDTSDQIRQTRDMILESMSGLRTVEENQYYNRLREARTDLQITGVLNGAKPETVESAQRLANALGKRILFASDQASKEGWYNREQDTIYINANAGNPAAQIVAHELTHSLEGAQGYLSLTQVVKQRMLATGENLEKLRNEKISRYQKEGISLTPEQADQEIVASYVAQHLLTDEQAVEEMLRDNRSLGRRILDWLDGLLAKLGSRNSQERQFLLKARQVYRTALAQSMQMHDKEQLRAAQAQAWREGDDEAADAMFDESWGDWDIMGEDPQAVQFSVTQEGDRLFVDDVDNKRKMEQIGKDDIKAIQSIGRMSVNQFSQADKSATERFAKMYWRDIGAKSPFFRAWFGDWRGNDQTAVRVANQRGDSRGTCNNEDTGWNIQVSGKVFNETRNHSAKKNRSAQPYLPYINDIVKKPSCWIALPWT